MEMILSEMILRGDDPKSPLTRRVEPDSEDQPGLLMHQGLTNLVAFIQIIEVDLKRFRLMRVPIRGYDKGDVKTDNLTDIIASRLIPCSRRYAHACDLRTKSYQLTNLFNCKNSVLGLKKFLS